MGTDGGGSDEHAAVLEGIDRALSSPSWEDRLAAVESIQAVLLDRPTERCVEHLVAVMGRLATDAKWEVRRAVVAAFLTAKRPAARPALEALTRDDNQWVRQAAVRGLRKFARITSSGDKEDRRSRLAFDTLKDLPGTSAQIYDAALRIGETYYDELAGDTAHELNTYRASVEGLLQEMTVRLRDGGPMPPDIDDLLTKLHGRSRYLRSLVTGLLEYAQPPSSEFELQPLAPVVAEAVDMAREKATSTSPVAPVRIIQNVPGDLSAECCRERLFQALVNLLSNAFEAVAEAPAPSIHIDGTWQTSQTVVISIRDNGIGMDAAQAESARKRFRSLRKARGGIGLGLPLAVKVVEREHSGRLLLESTLGVGTTVAVYLPLHHGAQV